MEFTDKVAVVTGDNVLQSITLVNIDTRIDEQNSAAILKIKYVLDIELMVLDNPHAWRCDVLQNVRKHWPNRVVAATDVPPGKYGQRRIS